MGPQAPTTSSTSPATAQLRSHAPSGPSRMYALQVRAFIEAAEVVDVDPDVIEEILDGFDGIVEVNEEDKDEDVDHQELTENGKDESNEDLDPEFAALVEEGGSLRRSSREDSSASKCGEDPPSRAAFPKP